MNLDIDISTNDEVGGGWISLWLRRGLGKGKGKGTYEARSLRRETMKSASQRHGYV